MQIVWFQQIWSTAKVDIRLSKMEWAQQMWFSFQSRQNRSVVGSTLIHCLGLLKGAFCCCCFVKSHFVIYMIRSFIQICHRCCSSRLYHIQYAKCLHRWHISFQYSDMQWRERTRYNIILELLLVLSLWYVSCRGKKMRQNTKTKIICCCIVDKISFSECKRGTRVKRWLLKYYI